MEEEKEMYWLVRQKDKAGKNVQRARVIKDRNGNVLTGKGEDEKKMEEAKISKVEVWKALKGLTGERQLYLIT